jgi:hypothetical protein
MNGWGAVAIFAGGVFSGGVLSFAWARIPIWREMDVPRFLWDFDRTISKADRVQPAFLVVTIVSSVLFAWSVDGVSRILALAAAGGFGITLIASVAILVPLQRRMIKMGSTAEEPIPQMRAQWFRGHLGRSVLSAVSFALLAVALTA